MAIEIDQMSQRLAEAEAKVKTEVARIKKKMQIQITELEMSLDVSNKQNIDMQKTIKIQSTKISVGVLFTRFYFISFVALPASLSICLDQIFQSIFEPLPSNRFFSKLIFVDIHCRIHGRCSLSNSLSMTVQISCIIRSIPQQAQGPWT